MFDAKCWEKIKAIFQFEYLMRKQLLPLSLALVLVRFRLKCHFMSCIFIRASTFYVGPFFIVFFFCCCYFLVRVRLLRYSIWGFNKEFFTRPFTSTFCLHLLSAATSAESYHSKSKHSTHSFKRLLKTLKREQNVLFVLHFLV